LLLQSAKEIAQCARINAIALAFLISTEGDELWSDVMVSNITDDPEYWRKRAEGARTLAHQMSEARTKAIMLEIAASYEKIAKWADERRDEPR
jgi:DNA-binding ferritin-like protein